LIIFKGVTEISKRQFKTSFSSLEQASRLSY